jgi:hypothetical protein
VGTFKPANDLGGSAVNDLPHNRWVSHSCESHE